MSGIQGFSGAGSAAASESSRSARTSLQFGGHQSLSSPFEIPTTTGGFSEFAGSYSPIQSPAPTRPPRAVLSSSTGPGHRSSIDRTSSLSRRLSDPKRLEGGIVKTRTSSTAGPGAAKYRAVSTGSSPAQYDIFQTVCVHPFIHSYEYRDANAMLDYSFCTVGRSDLT